MAICKFYANGYCRYGNKCRFEHIDQSQYSYVSNDYRNRSQTPRYGGQPSHSNVGFSFTKTLQNLAPSNQTNGRQHERYERHDRYDRYDSGNHFNQSFAFRRSHNEPMRAYTSANKAVSNTASTTDFSFNRVYSNIANERQPSRGANRVAIDDIDMDSTLVSHSKPSLFTNRPQTNTFQMLANSSANNILPAKAQTSERDEQRLQRAVASVGVYTSVNELSEQQLSQYEANAFAFKGIPILPPPQHLCR